MSNNNNKETKVTVGGVNFTEADILALKGEAGNTSVNTNNEEEQLTPAQTFTPASSVKISGHKKEIKPVIRNADGTPIENELVTRPNIDRFNSEDARRRLAEAAAAEKEAIANEALSPLSIHTALNALDRKVRRLEKALKDLDKTSH